ncbi:MAG: TldD/PmbA family protein [Deltaproteobacteria bacterium]|nr:TldD/PmbA family protein [Deltaproteobacteria bacterium]
MKRHVSVQTSPAQTPMDSDGIVERLAALLKDRTEGYEIFFSSESGLSVEAKDRAVDSLKVRSSFGVGLRAAIGGRQGFSFTSALTDDALNGLVERCLASGQEATPDEYVRYVNAAAAATGSEAIPKDIYDSNFSAIPVEEKIKKALLIEESAMSYDGRVKRIRKASYGETLKNTRVVNSNGVDRPYCATFYTASVTAVAEDAGDSQMGFEVSTSHIFGGIAPEEVGASAARNAVRMLGARKWKTVKCPAVFENSVVCEFIETIAGSFLADNVLKGKSMLRDKLGKIIASNAVSIYDDGVMKGGWATSGFDAEGAPRKTTPLIEAGVCSNYLYDSYWARRAGAESTGNAARAGFKGLPSVGVSNIYLKKGDKTLAGLISAASNGLFITELMGVHTVNTVNGDFSLGASGILIEGGELSYPVRGMAVSGNLLKLFRSIVECGRDLRFYGSVGAPSVLANEVEMSGD